MLVSLCTVAQAQRYRTLRGHGLDVNAVAFSPDSKLLATASSDRTLRLWEVATGSLVRTLEGHTASVNAVAFNKDGNLLASGDSEGSLYIWDVSRGEDLYSLKGQSLKVYKAHQQSIEAVAFGPQGTQVATASLDGSVQLFDISENWQQTFRAHRGGAYAVAFGPDGSTLYTAGADGMARQWALASGGQLRLMQAHRQTVRGLAVSPDGKRIVTGDLNGELRLWREAGSSQLFDSTHPQGVRSLAFSSDGRFILSAGRDGHAMLWDAEILKPVQTLQGHQASQWHACFSPNSQLVATASQDYTARIWGIAHLGILQANTEYLSLKTDRYAPTVDIAQGIPRISPQPQRFALIIANESYHSQQAAATDVAYATADGLLFAEYCEKRLGVPKANLLLLNNATAAQMQNELTKLALLAQNYGPDAELIFYYAGHGIPREDSQEAWLLPVDVNAYTAEQAVSVSQVVQKLSDAKPARLLLFLDACFTGQGRGGGSSVLATRGVVIRPKPIAMTGNAVIFSASSDDEPAYPYHLARHGLFSYFLMTLLYEKQPLSLGELATRLQSEVSLHALLLFNKPQNPVVLANPDLGDEWKSWAW
ncbi:MAG: caspase family protein [Bacteroidetes bacterium]|nr:caspase family protein [Bacteroidota bacterium]